MENEEKQKIQKELGIRDTDAIWDILKVIKEPIKQYEELNKPFNIEELFPSTLRELVRNDQFGTQLLLWFNRKQHNFAHISAETISFSFINKCTFSNFAVSSSKCNTQSLGIGVF